MSYLMQAFGPPSRARARDSLAATSYRPHPAFGSLVLPPTCCVSAVSVRQVAAERILPADGMWSFFPRHQHPCEVTSYPHLCVCVLTDCLPRPVPAVLGRGGAKQRPWPLQRGERIC